MSKQKDLHEVRCFVSKNEIENICLANGYTDYKDCLVNDIPKDDLEFLDALYFETDFETKKKVYTESLTRFNVLEKLENQAERLSISQYSSNPEIIANIKKIEDALRYYNPSDLFKGQKRQDRVDIKDIPNGIKILLIDNFQTKFYSSYNLYLEKPVYRKCPKCKHNAQIYYLNRDFINGKYFVKIYCKSCKESFEIPIEGFTTQFQEQVVLNSII